MITVGSLFSGIGGCAFQTEKQAVSCYNKLNRNTPRDVQPSRGSSIWDYASMSDSTPLKPCSKCKREYPATPEYFRRHKRYKSGIANVCRNCTRLEAKQYRDENPEQIKQSRREFYINHPGYNNQFANPEKQAIRARRHYKNNRIKIVSNVAAWKQNNPLQTKLHRRIDTHRRRMRVKENGGVFIPDDVISQKTKQNNLCYWCGEKLEKWEIDHYIPLSRGGSNSPDNIVIACPACNRSKHNRMPWEWEGRHD